MTEGYKAIMSTNDETTSVLISVGLPLVPLERPANARAAVRAPAGAGSLAFGR